MNEWITLIAGALVVGVPCVNLALRLRRDNHDLRAENVALVRHARAQAQRNAGILLIPESVEWKHNEDGTLTNAMPIHLDSSMFAAPKVLHTESYETGYRDGESSRSADYQYAITEMTNWPEGAEVTPLAVAERLSVLEGVVTDGP